MNSTNLSRRCFTCGLVGSVAFGLTTPASASLPVCLFSVTDGWDGTTTREFITRQARTNDLSGVPDVVDRIMRTLAFNVDFDIFIAEKEDNAFASVTNGRKILVVDVGFVSRINRVAGTEWGAIQIIAHEVGHHIAGFGDDRHRSELNADYWSGQACQRLGSAKDAAQKAILAVGTDADTPSHPNKRRRADVIGQGWEDAKLGKIDYSFCDSCR